MCHDDQALEALIDDIDNLVIRIDSKIEDKKKTATIAPRQNDAMVRISGRLCKFPKINEGHVGV